MLRVSNAGAALLLMLTSGLAIAAPDPTPSGDAWLFPRATFEDGRTREVDGRTGPTPTGEFVMGNPEARGIAEVCFAEGYKPTDAEWQAIYRVMQGAYTERYNTGTRWPGSQGNAQTLTWSSAPRPLRRQHRQHPLVPHGHPLRRCQPRHLDQQVPGRL